MLCRNGIQQKHKALEIEEENWKKLIGTAIKIKIS